jgi:nucleoid-associated protein YgaU
VKTVYAALVLMAALAAGCSMGQKPATADATPGALDVMPAANPEPMAPMPVVTTSTPAPMPVIAAPDTVTTQTPIASAAGGSSYTVKKGDTLYRLAKDHYGDGKQWQRIVSANPGLTPQSLRIGQTLIIP